MTAIIVKMTIFPQTQKVASFMLGILAEGLTPTAFVLKCKTMNSTAEFRSKFRFGSISMATMTEKKNEFIEKVRLHGFGKNTGLITRKEVMMIQLQYSLPYPSWLCADPARRVSHGMYSMPEACDNYSCNDCSDGLTIDVKISDVIPQVEESPTELQMAGTTDLTLTRQVDTISNELEKDSLIPTRNPLYIKHGHHSDVEKILSTGRFLPIWITGLSGNGKTFMVEQVCSKIRREMIRVNITSMTDEDDMIGGFRLINGETVWQDGPVILAMKRGAVLLLDECDLGTEKIMCLQPVLEGKGIFIKKINTFVSPAPNFNIVATSNTKGQGGDNSDRFVGTQIMNEAFLERFAITLEQEYPSKANEKKILLSLMENLDCTDEQFVDNLVNWADGIRRTFSAGGINDIITTRRLCQIINLYSVFGDRKKAINHATARFQSESREAFLNLYDKVDVTPVETPAETPASSNDPVNPDKERLNSIIEKMKNSSRNLSDEDLHFLSNNTANLISEDELKNLIEKTVASINSVHLNPTV